MSDRKNIRRNPFTKVWNPVAITDERHRVKWLAEHQVYGIRLHEIPIQGVSYPVDIVEEGTLTAYTEVAHGTPPGALQYRVDYESADPDHEGTGIIEFNSAANGKIVLVDYHATGMSSKTENRRDYIVGEKRHLPLKVAISQEFPFLNMSLPQMFLDKANYPDYVTHKRNLFIAYDDFITEYSQLNVTSYSGDGSTVTLNVSTAGIGATLLYWWYEHYFALTALGISGAYLGSIYIPVSIGDIPAGNYQLTGINPAGSITISCNVVTGSGTGSCGYYMYRHPTDANKAIHIPNWGRAIFHAGYDWAAGAMRMHHLIDHYHSVTPNPHAHTMTFRYNTFGNPGGGWNVLVPDNVSDPTTVYTSNGGSIAVQGPIDGGSGPIFASGLNEPRNTACWIYEYVGDYEP